MTLTVAIVAPEGAEWTIPQDLVGDLDLRLVRATSLHHLMSADEISSVDLVLAHATGNGEADATRRLRALPNQPDVVFLLDRADLEREAKLLGGGASGVLSIGSGEVAWTTELRARLEHRVLLRAKAQLAEHHGSPVSASHAMTDLLHLANRVAPGEASLLVLGETGAGKEWLARRIHAASPRADQPFVAVNCGSIPDGLAESELFGHVRGAFTGAVRNRRGHFEMAHQGTLFLDEIGDLPLAVQTRLLRALQDGTVNPVGSERSITVDVRIIAATHHALEASVANGSFRKDLYYRLAVVSMRVPALRDRQEDIPGLFAHYLGEFAGRLGDDPPGFDNAARRALVAYGWPGNIRELINVAERAVLLGDGETLGLDALPAGVRHPSSHPLESHVEDALGALTSVPFGVARARAVERFERRYIRELLGVSGGRVGEAARRAEMSSRSLFNKMRTYGVHKEDFKA